MSKGLAGFFLDRRIVLKFHDLRQISDSGIVWNRHNTVSRFLQTTQDFEHGRFSSTVFADERYAISIIDDKTDIMKIYYFQKIPNGVSLIKKVGPQKEKPTFIL